MGRYSYGGKTEADDIKKIATSFLKKYGYFQGWKSGTIKWTRNIGMSNEYKHSVGIEVPTMQGEQYIRIHHTQTDRDTNEKKDFDYRIPLTTTPCRYGGKRYWFICPWYRDGVYCGRRVGTLYKDGDYFACRHCYSLTYNSRKTNRRYKMFPLFNTLLLEQKIDELSQKIKRPYYRGRMTRKQRRLERLYQMATTSYRHYQET